jgi:lipid-A-disaccharide synthase
MSEIRYLSEDFINTAKICLQSYPGLQFVAPLVNQRIRDEFKAILQRVAPDLPIKLLDGKARDAMQSADAILLASGTATLEALLYKKPMVVAYKLHWLTNFMLYRLKMLKSPFVSLVNMLAGEEIAPEMIQDDVQPQTMADALINILESEEISRSVQEVGGRVHRELRLDASSRAAEAVMKLLESKQQTTSGS